MTRTEIYAKQAALANQGIIRGTVAEVKSAIVAVMDATEQFTSIVAGYTNPAKAGQTYRGAWKLHNTKALVAEADRKRIANPTRDDLLPVYDPNRGGWRTLRVDSIQSIRLHTAPGVSVEIPVMAHRP